MPTEAGPWDKALDPLRTWDASWLAISATMTSNPWVGDILPRKFIELVGVALNAACTNLSPEGTRRHIRAALAAGATREEILMVLKMASVLAIHSCSLGAPILLEESKAAGIETTPSTPEPPATPACDRMRASGQWNDAWDPFFQLDPLWTDAFMAAGMDIYSSGLLPPKLVELLSIA